VFDRNFMRFELIFEKRVFQSLSVSLTSFFQPENCFPDLSCDSNKLKKSVFQPKKCFTDISRDLNKPFKKKCFSALKSVLRTFHAI